MRIFAIGDVHGCSIALKRLDAELRFGASDTVVMLGDFINRGPDSKGVIDYLLELQGRCQLICLRGNHEIMMLEARENRSALPKWLSVGGGATLESYKCQTFDDIPQSHWKFLSSTVRYYETQSDFFVHANAYPDCDLADQPSSMLFWERFGEPSPHRSGRRMICGHTVQKSGVPKNVGHAVCIDTYAVGGEWLTCLDTQTSHYWQSNQKGQLRTGQL